MALTNNTRANLVAYLTRFADVGPSGDALLNYGGGSLVSAFLSGSPSGVYFGLQLQNQGKSQFSYQQGFVRTIGTGPNACDFAGDSADSGQVAGIGSASINYTYAEAVPAGGDANRDADVPRQCEGAGKEPNPKWAKHR